MREDQFDDVLCLPSSSTRWKIQEKSKESSEYLKILYDVIQQLGRHQKINEKKF